MSDEIKKHEKRAEILKAENEEWDQRLTKAQKRAMIKKLKKEFGTDWKSTIGGALKSVRINSETLQSLHSMGFGDSDLRSLNDPRKWRKG